MNTTADTARLTSCSVAAIPSAPPEIIPWAEEFVNFPKSARGKEFNVSKTPQIREPLERAAQTAPRFIEDVVANVITLVKPVQSGGSVFGEVLLLYWIMFARGFLQYNWSNDKRADERWKSRIYEILTACEPVARKIKGLPEDALVKCEADFGNIFFRMQGVFVPDNLDSDSITHQVNEEVHSWEPGHLQKAEGRQTAVWNPKRADISNAGKKGDQLHQALEAGTKQLWEVKCPGCGLFHRMRTRWDDRHPQLGGLRYDGAQCRREDGGYDYNRLQSTIRYQMPCGYLVHEDSTERRALSLSGRYSEPMNTGAPLTHRSYTYEAVSVDYIPFMLLIQEKHRALFARRHGDPEPWRRYITERECLFYDPDDVPIVGRVVLNTERKKNRDGLPNRKLRLFSLDRQQGEAHRGEFPHWWLVIRDVDEFGNSLLVYEGKLETDEQVIATLKEHDCVMHHGVADSGDDTTHVYLFCLEHGINAIKGGTEVYYAHPDGGRKIFSPERPLHTMVSGRGPKFDYVLENGEYVTDLREPLFWLYGKAGIRERLHWLRASTKWEVPGDVSEDYQSHMESEERRTRKHPRTGEEIAEYVQLKSRNDLYVDECYIAMQIEQAGLIGAQEPQPATQGTK